MSTGGARGDTRARAIHFKRGHERGRVPIAVSIFDSESIIFNLSEGICVMKADANSNKRGKKPNNTTTVEKKPEQIPALMRLYTQPNQS